MKDQSRLFKSKPLVCPYCGYSLEDIGLMHSGNDMVTYCKSCGRQL